MTKLMKQHHVTGITILRRILQLCNRTWIGLSILFIIMSCNDTSPQSQRRKEENTSTAIRVTDQKSKMSVNAPQNTQTMLGETPTPEVTPFSSEFVSLEKEVVLEFDVKIERQQVLIFGRTNLPNGTELLVSVDDKYSGIFTGQDSTVVNNGSFSAGPFGPNNGLADGIYFTEVVMPIPSVQPDAVRAIIGQKGENLKGKLIEHDTILHEPSISVKKEIFIGSDRKSAQIAQEQRMSALKREANEIYSELRRLVQEGNAMERYRQSEGDLELIRECGERMRQLKPKSEAIRARAATLPLRYFSLKTAAINVTLCVTCSRGSAMDSCKMAAQDLNDARKELR